MAKWFFLSTIVLIFFTDSCLAFGDTFDPARDVRYKIATRADGNFSTLSLTQLRNARNSNFVPENRINFDPNRPTRIFVHGFYSEDALMDSYAKAYLNLGNFNFIAVDWLIGAKTINYPRARHRVRIVGEHLAVFIDHLVDLGMKLDDLIIVGHSLGAHICGWAGKSTKSGKIPVIIGLDPALPLFSLKISGHRLNYSDAKYVQVIHTCGGRLGIKHAIGHADFYPNYGCAQPGCTGLTSDVCSHTRVHDLFQESLFTPVYASKCPSYNEIKGTNCSKTDVMAKMGGDADNMERAFGLYYFETRDKAPFIITNTHENELYGEGHGDSHVDKHTNAHGDRHGIEHGNTNGDSFGDRHREGVEHGGRYDEKHGTGHGNEHANGHENGYREWNEGSHGYGYEHSYDRHGNEHRSGNGDRHREGVEHGGIFEEKHGTEHDHGHGHGNVHGFGYSHEGVHGDRFGNAHREIHGSEYDRSHIHRLSPYI